MKLIKPSFEIIEQESGIPGIYKQIEKAARTCYKSEEYINQDSAKKLVDMLITNKHHAMLEHGTVYLKKQAGSDINHDPLVLTLGTNPYSRVNVYSLSNGYWVFATTNYRVLVEKNRLDLMKYCCDPTEHHAKRITVKFTCDRGVSHELVRHKLLCVA